MSSSLLPVRTTRDALMTTTWSPVLTCGAYVGLCLPLRSLATLLARRPSVRPVASTTYQSPLRSLRRGVQVLNFVVMLGPRSVHQLDHDHRSPVPETGPLVDDPRVAPRPVLEARHQVVEQPLLHLRLAD